MSKAIKCDRCKKCFDPMKTGYEFSRIGDFCIRDSVRYLVNEVTYRDEEIDLCPECTKAFNDFMRYGNKIDQLQIVKGMAKAMRKVVDAHGEFLAKDDILDRSIRVFLDAVVPVDICDSGDTDGDDSLCDGEPTERTSEPQQEGNG